MNIYIYPVGRFCWEGGGLGRETKPPNRYIFIWSVGWLGGWMVGTSPPTGVGWTYGFMVSWMVGWLKCISIYLSIYLSLYLYIDSLPRRPDHNLTALSFPVLNPLRLLFRYHLRLKLCLGRSWVVSGGSWDPLGPSWGGLGRLLGPSGKLLGHPEAIPNLSKK